MEEASGFLLRAVPSLQPSLKGSFGPPSVSCNSFFSGFHDLTAAEEPQQPDVTVSPDETLDQEETSNVVSDKKV